MPSYDTVYDILAVTVVVIGWGGLRGWELGLSVQCSGFRGGGLMFMG